VSPIADPILGRARVDGAGVVLSSLLSPLRGEKTKTNAGPMQEDWLIESVG